MDDRRRERHEVAAREIIGTQKAGMANYHSGLLCSRIALLGG